MITLKKKFSDIDSFVINKKVILRVDLNLPLYSGEFSDFTRLEKIVPTVNYLLDRKAKIILVSHLGRPDGKKNDDFSLKNLSLKVSTYMKSEVFFLDENINNIKKEKIEKLFKTYNIIMLENLRFFPEEEKNDENFAKKISSFADIYVNECFSVCHRKHSSITSIPKYLPSFPGKLLEKEISNLKKLITISENSSSVAVFGGAKVSSKLKVIEYYVKNFSKIIIGGAMANTFIKSNGGNIGKSLFEKNNLEVAINLQKKAIENNVQMYLPNDFICSKSFEDLNTKVFDSNNIPEEYSSYDIGDHSIKLFKEVILNSKKIIWNGPMGVFEIDNFSKGTYEICNIIAESTKNGAFSLVGGGDSVASVKKNNKQKEISFISTGGGALIEYLSNETLPSLKLLNS